nr:isopeptide-forming domain-containing fimbrial protein [Microbacterium hydrocarbonoxydans]
MSIRGARKRRQQTETEQATPRWGRTARKLISGLATTAVVASSMIFIGGTVTAAPAAAADPFLCTPGAVFVQSTTEIREFAVNEQGGAPGEGGTLGTVSFGTGHSDNGLGISSGGRYAYTVTNSSSNKVLAKYDRVTDETARTSFTLTSAVLRGAVNPVTGVYYFASGTANNAINIYAWNESVSPQNYVQVGTLRPTAGSSAFGANGDMAFSASGQLVLVADQDIYAADLPTELVSSTATIDAKQVHDLGDGVQGNGIAFGNLGHIFVSVSGGGNRIIEVDLPRGETVNTTSLGGFSPTDMSSCTFPNTLTLKKDLPEGRHAPTDQFALSIQSPAGYSVPQTSVTTTGDQPDLQRDYAGPVFTNQGDTFDLAEAAAGSADPAGYDTSLVCEQINGDGSVTPVAVSATGQVTQPAGPLGTDVTCVYSNVRLAPGLDLRKTSDPADGTAVGAGQRITYQVAVENTGNTVLDDVEVADDLSSVFSFAEYQDDLATTVDGIDVVESGAVIADDMLTWTGALEPGQIMTFTYSVIVDDDVEGESIANSVTASGTPPGGDPIVPPAVTTVHPIAGFTLIKTADPASGAVVQPGQIIDYTVTGTNTGATTLDPATIADDLAGVLAHAEYNSDITTAIDGSPVTAGAATLTGSALAWNGTLQPGQVVTITYSVTVDDEASGQVLSNVASGTATPTTPNPADPTGPQIPGEPIVPPTSVTEHPVLGSGFTISKTADPASGTAVSAGDTIEYTVTGTNTGDTDLSPVTITDDLTGVLDDAVYNDDVTADRGSATVVEGTLTWTGSIPRGESVTLRYSVTVDAGVESALLRNIVNGAATPRIPTDPSDPESPTTPGTTITPPQVETTHPVVDTGFEVTKTADPASGTAVGPGDTIEYTVTGTNTGNTVLAPAAITDDLTSVLANAAYNGDVSATTGTVDLTGSQLTWTGELGAGDDVVITYTVTVDGDATGVLLRNVAEGAATPLIPSDPTDPESPSTPGAPVSPPPAVTQHPVVAPGFAVSKTADPVTGTAVDPGSVIEYTVTGTNTGDTVLDPAEISDDLARVLSNASYNDDVDATRGTATVKNSALVWTGSLKPGENVVITYSVTVDGGAGGETITNTVAGEATPLVPADPSDPESPTTPGAPIVPPTVVTEHRVTDPGFEFSKTADPASGTAVDPGDVITYVLTGVNTGETALDSVEIVDDLAGVLDHASFVADPVVTIDGGVATPAVVTDGELSWTGALAIGQTVTITYSVTVGPDAAGRLIANSATAVATPPGGEQITPPPVTTTNPVNEPGFSVSKSAAPAPGTAVDPGTVVTYTVTGANTGETVLDPVGIVDDLSGVLDAAEFNHDAVALVDGSPAAAPELEGETLSWAGALGVGETVTITYSVTVNGDAGGETLENSVTGRATPPGGVPAIETPPAVTVNPVNAPGFELVKTADPAAGTRVDPGSVITYTVTGVNTGETVLDPVMISDDLSGVLAHAEYNGDVTASVQGVTVAAPTVQGDDLSWQGALDIGERVAITYSVTVDADAGGETISNVAEGTATAPGGAELTPPPASTEHRVGAPGFTFAKTANVSSGTAVAVGSVVTYTLTGVNTGETDLAEVVVSDDLAKVLDHAALTGAVIATVGDHEVTAPVVTGTELRWAGALAEGETVTVTYSVTVDADAAGATLENVATALVTSPGDEPLPVVESATVHPVQSPLAITGGQLAPWVLVLALTLLLGGAALLILRRRASIS